MLITRKVKKIFLQLTNPDHHELKKLSGVSVADWIQVAIWFAGIALAIGLCILDFVPLFSDYRNNNLATQAQVVLNTTFKPPQIIVCIPLYKVDKLDDDALMKVASYLYNGTDSDCPECQKLANKSWDVWNSMHQPGNSYGTLPNWYRFLSLVFVRKFLASIDSHEDPLAEGNEDWNGPILSAGINFLIWQASVDYWLGYAKDLAPNISLSRTISSSGKWRNSTLLDEIFTRVIQAVCRNMEFATWDYNLNDTWVRTEGMQSCEDFLLNTSTPVTLDWFGLWIPLPVGHTAKMQKFSFWVRDDDQNSSIWTPGASSELHGFEIYSDTAIQYVSAIDTTQLALSSTPHDRIREGVVNTATVTYSVHMRARETRSGRTCHNEVSPSVCLAKCTKLWLVEHCKCIPFSFYKGLALDHSDLPYCTEFLYAACNATSFKHVQHDYCFTKCKDACEYTSYNWQVSHDVTEGVNNTLAFEVILDPIFNPFAEFTWTVKDTPEQFLSQAGGLLNFYLGLSGLSIFTFVVSMIDFVRWHYRLRKTKSTKKEAGTVTTWQWTRQNTPKEEPEEKKAKEDVITFDEISESAEERRLLEKVDRRIAALKAELRGELARIRKASNEVDL